jgi:hypothetical protein
MPFITIVADVMLNLICVIIDVDGTEKLAILIEVPTSVVRSYVPLDGDVYHVDVEAFDKCMDISEIST